MRSGTIAFLCGVLLLHAHPTLPDAGLAEFLPLALLAGIFIARWRTSCLFVAGFLWTLLWAHTGLLAVLPAALEGRDVVVVGEVRGLALRTPERTGFDFYVDRIHSPPNAPAFSGSTRLNWYGRAPVLRPGERWLLTLRMKRPRGFSNPGGFDYEGWLFAAGIRATGYVRSVATARRLASGAGRQWVDRARWRLARKLHDVLGTHPQAGLVKALVLGGRGDISTDQWRTLRATGTAHLMAISGLHVGLVAGAAFAIARFVWALCGASLLWLAAPRLAALAAIAAACSYAALAGFSIPTQRAVVMVAAYMCGIYFRRQGAPSSGLALAALAVLIIDPMAVLSAGFWLSFVAVAVILLGMGAGVPAARAPAPVTRWWRAFGRVQWLVSLGLLPLALFVFGRFPLLSPVANLIAVPWTGMLVVPFALSGMVLVTVWPMAGGWLLGIAADALGLLWPCLDWLAGLQWSLRAPGAASLWSLGAAAVGVSLLLAPAGIPGRWLGWAWLAPLLFSAPARPRDTEVWLTMLDVGQGLAVIAQTRHHVLIYDTGPRFSARLDAGRAVILPYLAKQGIRAVDTLLMSHADGDHVGGAGALLEGIPVRRIVTNAEGYGVAASPCREGARWEWDGVVFEVLHPRSERGLSDNDGSCVLLISTADTAALLPGDIEIDAEWRLVSRYGGALSAAVLVVAHHGSRTSSTETFLDAVQPRYALISAGYRNRFGFPHPQVVARLRERHIKHHQTAFDGAVTLSLSAHTGVRVIRLNRHAARRYWHGR